MKYRCKCAEIVGIYWVKTPNPVAKNFYRNPENLVAKNYLASRREHMVAKSTNKGETMSRFLDQFALCEKGDEIIYHVGFHCVDSKGHRNAAARDAWKAYESGDVLLYQRRVGFDKLAYCAKVIR
jgi:hypothetical protein